MADDGPAEDYPTEIEENLNDFESSLSSIQNMVQTLVSVSRSDNLLNVCESKCINQQLYKHHHIWMTYFWPFCTSFKLDPLDRAKLDLMSAYALNSMFWSKILHLHVLLSRHV